MRLAVYAAPGARGPALDPVGTALAERAERWLGRSTGSRTVSPTGIGPLSRAEIDAVTRSPRRYGFHGTLKAPFRLAPGHDADGLERAVARCAALHGPVRVPRLALRRISSFLALVPGDPAPELDALAADVVTDLDAHRAPTTPAERLRRDPDALPARERELLDAWGYPYVLDRFRFHLTLTDALPEEYLDAVEAILREHFSDLLGRDLVLDALCVFAEPAPDAPFELRTVHQLTAPAPLPLPEGTR